MSGALDLVAYNRKWLRLHKANKYQAEAARRITALLAEVERLRVERDQAREECGHAKAMRKFASEELDQFIAAKSRADATIARVQKALAGHPRCERHAGDDPITCGWKKAVLDVRTAIEGTDS